MTRVRAIRDSDRPRLKEILDRAWGPPGVVSRGRMHSAHTYPGFLAVQRERIVGYVTLEFRRERCEVVVIEALRRRKGIGSRLLRAAERAARSRGCREIWLVTTNDNLDAIRFYQRRGMRLWRLHAGAIERSRALKPSIPAIGNEGIPIRDEVELIKRLEPGRTSPSPVLGAKGRRAR